jgi:predicted kinase
MTPAPTLHMICGKIAAGKSTLAARLGRADGTVLVAEDDWLSALFPDQLSSLEDYARCSSRLRRVMGPHVASLLRAGVSVVLDFPANTVAQRDGLRGIFEAAGASHRLHVLEASDALCLARLRARNARGGHPFAVTEAEFRRFTGHFAPPSPDEGFDIVTHAQE